MGEVSMGRKFDLEERVAMFASEAIAVCESLPPKVGASHISDQLFRSATSVAANYAEASVPESRKDFAHKMNIALKELVESRMWLKIICLRHYLPEESLHSLLDETEALVKIFYSSVSTARKAIASSS